MDTVTVTGSRIKRSEVGDPTPVASITDAGYRFTERQKTAIEVDSLFDDSNKVPYENACVFTSDRTSSFIGREVALDTCST